jgi:hypothetical protein
VGLDQGVTAQLLANCLAKGAGSFAVDDPHKGQSSQEGIVQVLVEAG